MTGTIEEHVTSYNKHAQRRITATDTRLSNGSIISKTKEERKKNNNNNNNNIYVISLLFFFIVQYLLTKITCM